MVLTKEQEGGGLKKAHKNNKMAKSKKGYIAPLAMALIVVFVFILVASIVPEVKATAIQLVKAFTGG